jgi:hypothetical protein
MNAVTKKFDDASRYAWACSQFGLQPGASPQAVRAAILTYLEDAGFVPPAGWRQAIWLLSNPQSPQAWPENGYDAFRETVEHSIAEEVDRFACEFFSLPRGPRRAQWTQLLKQATAFPRLRARLTQLQAGLEAESTAPISQDQQDTTVIERIRRLFVLKPGEQSSQRRQWLATMTGDWRPAARRVRMKYPRLAQLDRDFISALESGNNGPATAKKGSAAATHTNLAAAITVGAKLPPTKPRGTSVGVGSGFVRSRGLLVGIVLFGIVRLLAQFASSDHSPEYQTPPSLIKKDSQIPGWSGSGSLLPRSLSDSLYHDKQNPAHPASKDRQTRPLPLDSREIDEILSRIRVREGSALPPPKVGPRFVPPSPGGAQAEADSRYDESYRSPSPSSPAVPSHAPVPTGPIHSPGLPSPATSRGSSR